MEMNGGGARTPCVPLFSTLFNRVETEGLLDYQVRAGDHFHCTVEPSARPFSVSIRSLPDPSPIDSMDLCVHNFCPVLG